MITLVLDLKIRVVLFLMDSNWSSPAFRGKRALVLGASGFIGQAVARALAHAEADLIVADRRPQQSGTPGKHLIADLLPEGSAATLIREVQPDIVFNLAGYGIDRTQRDAALAERINGSLAGEAARAASHLKSDWKGLRFVHVGSALEYGVASGDLDEASEPKPTTLYGETKLAGTLAVARAGPLCLTARLFTIYGPGEIEGRLLPSLAEAARSGRHLPLTEGLQQRDFTYVGDVAEGLLRLGALSPPDQLEPIVNLATGELQTVKHFVTEAARVLGLRLGQLGFGELPTRVEEMAHLPVAVHRLHRRTGWLPTTSIAQGVLESMETYV